MRLPAGSMILLCYELPGSGQVYLFTGLGSEVRLRHSHHRIPFHPCGKPVPVDEYLFLFHFACEAPTVPNPQAS